MTYTPTAISADETFLRVQNVRTSRSFPIGTGNDGLVGWVRC